MGNASLVVIGVEQNYMHSHCWLISMLVFLKCLEKFIQFRAALTEFSLNRAFEMVDWPLTVTDTPNYQLKIKSFQNIRMII